MGVGGAPQMGRRSYRETGRTGHGQAHGSWYAASPVTDALAFPPDVARLFWDVDPATVDLERHRDYVMERVMARGGWVAMQWLRRTYAPEQLADFRHRKGTRLAPRELAYWAVIAGIEVPIPRGGGRPSWAGS